MDSFVVHRQYLEHIPEEEKGKWLSIICNYGLDNIEPKLNSWIEAALWEKIKFRIDHDRSIYCKRINNLKQNKGKSSNVGTPTKDLSDTDSDNIGEPTDSLSVGLNVNVNDNVNLNLNLNDDMYSDSASDTDSKNVENSEIVEKSTALHCTTSLSQNIKNTTLLYGFTLTPKQTKSLLDKTEKFVGDIPSLVNFIVKKTSEQYEVKPEIELKKLIVNALTKYPESYFDDFYVKAKADKKAAEKESRRLIYFNPPSRRCTCGVEFEERPDIDDKTNINYTGFKCPECNTMLTCENGKWVYSQGASDMAIASV